MNLAYHAFICDVFGSWFATFSGADVLTMHRDRRALYFLFNVVLVFTLNSAFNAVGCGLHLFHCIYYDLGGPYSSGKELTIVR